MHVIIDKLLTTYQLIGEGDKILIFLHGWADSGKTFDMLARELLIADDNYTAVLLDLPGFGGTDAPSGAWDVSDYADFIAKFVAKTKYQPLAIIGHSNGGTIAINGLATNVLATSKLVLIGSAGIRNKTAKKEIMRLLSKPAKHAIKLAPKPAQKRIRQKLYSAVGSDYLIAEHMQETFKKVVSYDIQKEAARVTVPTCLIYGEQDTSTPPAYGDILSGLIPSASLHRLPLAGHFVHQEQAFKVARIITDFLAGTTSK